MNSEKNNKRMVRLKQKISVQIDTEYEEYIENIRARNDYVPEIEHFLSVLKYARHPEKMRGKTEGHIVLTMCIQAPLELFHAAGVRVFKVACGSFASMPLAAQQLPALACPMMKSVMGMLHTIEDTEKDYNIVIPTTCDWVVKFSELAQMKQDNNYYMELPHIRESEKSSERWLEEVYGLKKYLETITDRRISKKDILHSISAFMRAYVTFLKLIQVRRDNQISSIYFALIANALVYDDIDEWRLNAERYIENSNSKTSALLPVFLAGSPILFPNFKLLNLLEDAGMSVIADDVCSMERVFTGATSYKDKSEYELLKALAQRNHKACICPTFVDNQRRLNSMLNVLSKENIKGVIFHVLKGCHPYDIESMGIENKLKALGYRFLKIETDYVKEDEQNIVTRLEAFRQTLL